MPELLAPAGGMQQLEAALRFGADAVYVGMPRSSLRAHAVGFVPDALAEAARRTHAAGKKIYVTLNILPTDAQLQGLLIDARHAAEAGVDAAIVADAGAVDLLRAELPELPLHLSTQANTLNARAAGFWHRHGVSRVILARELSLAQIADMRKALPDSLALEAFVHGAMCMAYSGRCLLSAAINGRSANGGDCTQPCRWQYALHEAGSVRPALPIEQDAQGTAVLSAGDLCMIAHLPALCEAGLSSFKIEGRMKGEYYVATVVGAYRRALDALAQGADAYERMLPELLEALRTVSHHRFDTGFFFGTPQMPGGAGGYTQTAEHVGSVLECLPDGLARVEVKNRFFVGDALVALTPQGEVPLTVRSIALEPEGELVDCANRPKSVVRLPLPSSVAAGDLLRGSCRNHNHS